MEMTNMTPSPAPKTPKLGDILVCSWGYDQTNIDFYQVVAVTAASVRIRHLNKEYVTNDGPSCKVMPKVNEFSPSEGFRKGDPEYTEKGALKRVKSHGDTYSVNLTSYSNAYLWDGTPAYETGAMYGH